MQPSHNIQLKHHLARLFRTPQNPQPQKFYYGRRAFSVPQEDKPERQQG